MYTDKYIILKPVGVTAEQLHNLHDFVASEKSRIFAGPENHGIDCVQILTSKMDEKFKTYTLEIMVYTIVWKYEYEDATGKTQKHPVRHGPTNHDHKIGNYCIQIPSTILLGVLNILQLTNNALEVSKRFDV